LFNWPSSGGIDPWTVVDATMDALMVLAAQALQCTKPEACHVAAMVFDVVHDGSDDGAAFGFAHLAQGM
jgi:hypothetical protein